MNDSQAFDHQSFLSQLSSQPGVYQMFDGAGELLYVGKAKNLKKRVSSYFGRSALEAKTLSMVLQIARIEVTVTRTETEALLLEANLIKQLRPKYNIVLRDDKSYPYIYLSDDEFPRLGIYRGARSADGRYFGPYPSAAAARESLNLIQKLFPVRQCEESYFRHRSRACLQYQIGRCSGPCVGLVDAQEYSKEVNHVVLFLEGRSDELVSDLINKMDTAAEQQQYEQAAHYRDQIKSLRKIQENQIVSRTHGDFDVLACVLRGGLAVVHQLIFRGGSLLGTQSHQPRIPLAESEEEVLTAFISQFYLHGKQMHDLPKSILVDTFLGDRQLLIESLSANRNGQISIAVPQRGDRLRWMQMARENAQITLHAQLAGKQGMREKMANLMEELDLEDWPKRIECFDVSHTQGERAVASCVVFDLAGPVKSDYRRYNMRDGVGGDDYASLSQALMRRYQNAQEETVMLPDLILIDGGKGQLAIAHEVMQELQLTHITLVGVAKGRARKPGSEQLFFLDRPHGKILSPHSMALALIQEIRDEAHRFAIMGHRGRREKARTQSELEQIEGVGPKRRQQLLRHFGGLSGIKRAGVDDLCRVAGINRDLAQRIYDTYH